MDKKFTVIVEKQDAELDEYNDNNDIQIIQFGDNEKICGKYVIFIKQNKLSKELLSQVNDFIKKYGEIELIKIDSAPESIIHLDNDFKHSFLNLENTFIRADLIKDLTSADFLFLNKTLIDIGRYGIVYSNLDFNECDFTKRIDSYMELLDYSDEYFVQYALINDINQIIMDDRFIPYKSYLTQLLQKVNDDVIKNHDGLNNRSRRFIFYLKNNEFHYLIKGNRLQLKSGNYVINGLHGHVLTLDIVHIRNNFLNISGFFKSSCDPDFLNFEAVVKNKDGSEEVFKASKNEYPTTGRHRRSYLGIDWEFYPCFDVKIPIKDNSSFKVNIKIKFSENGDEIYLNPRIDLSKTCNISKLSNYYIKDSKIVLFNENEIHLIDYSIIFRIKLELTSIVNILKSGQSYSFYSIYIRIIYFILGLYLKNKRIWLFADRQSIADDNAKHLFSYAITKDDKIHKYFILDKKSKDFKKMRKISKNIVKFGSLKHKILYLYAEKFISSHSDPNLTNPFFNIDSQLYSGLTTREVVFLQHGITLHDVSYWLRKFYHNFLLFVTASDLEKDSIIHPNYNYGEDVVKTLGFPRYDNLRNDNLKKQILFMPTWRKHISNENEFINSQYFKMINGFLNNEKLLSLIKDKGYKIIFKPHFELLKYCDLLNIPDEILLSEDESYQELFNKSMLLITDYSSVFFDFAYLKKPVIYYRDNNNFHYNSGYFDFETMGFGEITYSLNELIDLINNYISNDCVMKKEYKLRVDNFFKYTDKNNCKRVYDWLFNHI